MKNLNSNEKFILDLYRTRINSRSYSAITEGATHLDDGTRVPCINIEFSCHCDDSHRTLKFRLVKLESLNFFLEALEGPMVVYKTTFNTGLEFVLRHIEEEGTAYTEGKVNF